MRQGDLYWVELPPAFGREQSGRRPAIIFQDDVYGKNLPLVIVIPVTGTIEANRFAETLTLLPDDANNLRTTFIALVFQIRAVDRRLLREKIGAITSPQIEAIHSILAQLTGRIVTP